MASLKDTIVQGSLRVTDTLFSTTSQFQILRAPTTSGGTTFGPGTANNLLRSNGTSVYWSALAASDIPTISITDKTSGTLTVARGGTGQTSIANIQAGKDGDGNTISSTYLKLSGGTLTGDLGIIFGDTDKFINFWYNTNKIAGASWRLGALGSGSNDTNYFVIQSGTSTSSATAWNNAIRIGQNTYDIAVGGNLYPLIDNTKTLGTSSNKWSNVYAATFTGNLTGNVTGTLSTTRITLPGITGTGTVGADQGASNTSTRYKPAEWTFSVSITPTDGDIITIKQPCAGHDYGTWLTTDGGSSYHPIVYNISDRITTHFANGQSLMLMYDSAGTASVYARGGAITRATVTGVWRVLNTYNTNSDVTGYYILSNGFRLTAGTTYKLWRYGLFARTSDGTYESFTNTSGTATTKEKNPHGFLPEGKIYWNSASGTDYSGITNFSAYEQYHSIDYRYTFNISTTGIPASAYTYIKWTYNTSDGLLYLADEWFATSLPISADGFIYQRIGSNYYGSADYRGSLLLNNPYYFYDNGIKLWYPTNAMLIKSTLGTVSTSAQKFLKDTGTWEQIDWGDITSKPLTLTAAATGFTIAGGTTSKTLTVSEDTTLKGGSSAYLAYYSANNTISGHSCARFSDTYSSSTKNGKNEIILGNGTASTSNGSAYGQLALYSSGTKGTYLASAANSTQWYTATLPAASGTIAYTTSNITGTAANVTGTVAIDHGGTGATTAAAARVNLGLGTATNNYCINANANGSSETLSMAYTVDNSNNSLNGHSLRFLIRRGGLQLLDESTNFSACWTLETRQGRASVTAGNGSVETTRVDFGDGKSFPTASYYVVATVYSNVLARIRDVRIGTDNYTTTGFDITAVSTSGSTLTDVPVNWIAILQ